MNCVKCRHKFSNIFRSLVSMNSTILLSFLISISITHGLQSLFPSLYSFLYILYFTVSSPPLPPFTHTILSPSARPPFPSSHLFYSSFLPELSVRLSLPSSLPGRLHISLSLPTSLLLVTFPFSCSPSVYPNSLCLCTFLLLPPHVTLSLLAFSPSFLPLFPPSLPSLPTSFTNTQGDKWRL